MRSKIALLTIGLLSILIMACPLPQLGPAPSRTDGTGGAATTTPAAGTISVVNDEARSQAVYINESGARFDVAAEEYPGGPLVKCVEFADFTQVPASTDDEALPVKAQIAGMREDGTPGVWEVYADDTMALPQPEQTTDNTARCIIAGDMPSMPDGVQLRYGWTFHVTTVSADGKLLVGYGDNKHDVTIGGAEILAGSAIGIYWRAYKLPFSRIVIVSAPHVIGTITRPPAPAGWTPDSRRFTRVLAQLKQFFVGKLAAYIELPASVEGPNGGPYIVKGTDQDGEAAFATIDKDSVLSVTEFPDLTVTSVSVSPSPTHSSDLWRVSATVMNRTTGQTLKPSTLTYRLSKDGNLDSSDPTIMVGAIPSSTIPPLGAGQSYKDNLPADISLPALFSIDSFFPDAPVPWTYTVFATVTADVTDGEVDPSNNVNSTSFTITVAQPTTTGPELTVTITPTDPPALLASKTWPFAAKVTTNSVQPVSGELTITLTNTFTGKVSSFAVPFSQLTSTNSFTDPYKGPIAGRVGPGKYTVEASAGNGSKTDTAALTVNYDGFGVDAYDPSGPGFGYSLLVLDLVDSAGNVLVDSAGNPLSDGADGMGSNQDSNQTFYPAIYYFSADGRAPVDGIAPGSTFYARVRGFATDTVAYAIRVFTNMSDASTHDAWYPGTTLSSSTDFENDDPTVNQGTPVSMGLNTDLSRVINPASDIDWIKITLP
jgi:hypothetical protein